MTMFPKPLKRVKHKFRAQPTAVGNVAFPSKLEAAVYRILLRRGVAGELRNIRQQVNVRLKDKCEHCGDGPLDFTVDFSFEEAPHWRTAYAEAKGVRTSSYIKREKAWKKNPPAKLEVWGGSYKCPQLVKVIEP